MHTVSTAAPRQGGFTIAELLVIIAVMSILLAVGVDLGVGYQTRARDAERHADAQSLTQNLERYYRAQVTSVGATYPPTTIGTGGLQTYIDSPDITIAPGQSGNSLVIATNATAQTPTVNQYVYQPLNLDGSLCTATPCVRYKVFYRTENDNSVVTRESMRQQ